MNKIQGVRCMYGNTYIECKNMYVWSCKGTLTPRKQLFKNEIFNNNFCSKYSKHYAKLKQSKHLSFLNIYSLLLKCINCF